MPVNLPTLCITMHRPKQWRAMKIDAKLIDLGALTDQLLHQFVPSYPSGPVQGGAAMRARVKNIGAATDIIDGCYFRVQTGRRNQWSISFMYHIHAIDIRTKL